jgi:hypothetical protein
LIKNHQKDNKRRRLGKKGFIFDTLIIFVFLIVMLTALLVFSAKNKSISNERKIGDLQYSLIATMQSSEKSLLYLDYATKYSAIKTIYNLSANGGTRNAKCGRFKEHTLWAAEGKNMAECFPNYLNETKNMFDSQLDAYITFYNVNNQKNLQEVMPPYFAANNYEYRIGNGANGIKIQGFAKQNLVVENKAIKYAVKPNFETKLRYNLNEYEYLKDAMIGIINQCYKNETGDELDNCVKGEVVDPLRIAEHEGRTYAFEYNSITISPEEKPIVYKFAFYIENESQNVPLIRPLKNAEEPSADIVTGLNQLYSLSQGIDSNMTKAIIKQESNGNTNAIRCEQSYESNWKEYAKSCIQYGCNGLIDLPQGRFHKVSCSYGLMQIMYPTAMEACKDIVTTPESLFDPAINVECGTRYLKKMLDQCKEPKRAIYAYKHGSANCKTADVVNDEYVMAIVNNCNSIGGCVLA